MQDNAVTPAVKAYMQPINHALGQAIEGQSPLFAQAQQKFRELSEPINQMQNMQNIIKTVQNSSQDAQGNFFLSPAKLGSLIKNGQINSDYHGWQPLQDALSPEQYDTLVNVHKDAARSNLTNSPAFKPAGSDTFSNLASNNALASGTGGVVNANFPLLGKVLPYESANSAVVKKMREIIQDPAKTRAALLAVNPAPTSVGNALQGLGAGAVYGGYR
jgi:hypothetical protein